MNVHLLRTPGIDDRDYFDLLDFLQHFNSPYKFITKEKPVEITLEEEVEYLFPDDPRFHRKLLMDECSSKKIMESVQALVPWENIFDACNKYRRRYRLPVQDVVILLTAEGNELNWFSGFDSEVKGNYFISGSNWESYTGSEARYPMAYQVATMLLKHSMFCSESEFLNGYHRETRGCMMDFCENKKQVSIKMRTADICNQCLEILKKKNVTPDRIAFSTRVMEFIRNEIKHTQRFRLFRNPDMEIKGYMHHIHLPFLAGKQVPLTPLERAVYLVFLSHPEGIKMNEMAGHRTELANWVHQLSNSDNRQLIEASIHELCQPESNSMSEKMARIKKKFTDILGEQVAQTYIISGPNGGLKKIAIDRQAVKWPIRNT